MGKRGLSGLEYRNFSLKRNSDRRLEKQKRRQDGEEKERMIYRQHPEKRKSNKKKK